MADFLLLVLVSLSALIIWDNYKKGHVSVAPEDDYLEEDEDNHPF